VAGGTLVVVRWQGAGGAAGHGLATGEGRNRTRRSREARDLLRRLLVGHTPYLQAVTLKLGKIPPAARAHRRGSQHRCRDPVRDPVTGCLAQTRRPSRRAYTQDIICTGKHVHRPRANLGPKRSLLDLTTTSPGSRHRPGAPVTPSSSIETWCVDALSSSSCQAAAAGAGSTALDPARPPPSRRRRSLQRHPEVVARAAGDDRDVLRQFRAPPVGGRREQERQPA